MKTQKGGGGGRDLAKKKSRKVKSYLEDFSVIFTSLPRKA